MMGAKEKATALHKQGFNCAQSVLCALGSYTGMDDETALAVAAGFGGGVSCGEICGAAAGAVMALGMACASADAKDAEARMKVRRNAASFNRDFRAQFGCIRCADLKQAGKPCAALIEYAAEQAENILDTINT